MELYDIFNKDKFYTNTFDIHDIVETNEPIYQIDNSYQLKKYQCERCDKTFKSKSGYHNHKLSYIIENYKCNICDKKFKYKSSLNNHMNRHKNIMHKCDMCDKKYYNKRTLVSHKNTIHRFH